MSTSTSLSVNQKGGIVLLLLIVVLVVGLAVGVYLVSQNTNLFSQAGYAQKTIPYPNPSHADISSSGQTGSVTYENPFDEKPASENPFDTYQNPFNNL